MDVDDAVRFIKRQFGDEYDIIINNDDIYQWIYDAETQIIREISANLSIVTAPGSSFPLSVPDSVNIRRVTFDGVALDFIFKDEIDMVSAQEALAGDPPRYWYRFNKQVCLWPDPTASANVTVEYVKVPVLMSGDPTANNFTVPEPYHNDIIKYALARAHNKNHDAAFEQSSMQLFNQNLSFRADESQSRDGPVYKLGDPMDYSDYPDIGVY